MRNEPIAKPMSVVRNEFINSMTELINKCQLPLFVIEGVIKDIYSDIHILAQRQLEADLKNYHESLKTQKEDAVDALLVEEKV